jgi:predicted RNA-binding protein with PUA-like domain
MNYWLVKSEPETWSWAMQEQGCETMWDGVRNYQAQRYLKAMQIGDLCLFYHSGQERAIVGVIRVIGPAVLDPSDPAGRFIMVPMETVKALSRPVHLATLKTHPQLQTLPLIRQSRLSVMPIDQSSWDIIQGLSL